MATVISKKSFFLDVSVMSFIVVVFLLLFFVNCCRIVSEFSFPPLFLALSFLVLRVVFICAMCPFTDVRL